MKRRWGQGNKKARPVEPSLVASQQLKIFTEVLESTEINEMGGALVQRLQDAFLCSMDPKTFYLQKLYLTPI